MSKENFVEEVKTKIINFISNEKNKPLEVKIKKLHKDAVIPFYTKEGDMGMDLTAVDVEYNQEIDCYVYHTGLAFELPKGYGMLIFPRSSNRKTDVYMPNSVGILDEKYRDELLVCFKNRTSFKINSVLNKIKIALSNVCNSMGIHFNFELSNIEAPYEIGDRIAQIVILPYPYINFLEVDELSKDSRGGGFGSTGK